MMNRTLLAVSILALAPLPALADPYLKFGAGLGTTDMGDTESVYGPGASVSDNVSRAAIGVGARINANIGLEASYLSNVENSVSNSLYKDSLSQSGAQLALYGYLPLARNIDLYGKVSANLMDTDYRTNYSTGYDQSKSGTYLGFGGGVEFNVSPTASVRIGAEQIQLTQVVSSSVVGGNSGDYNVNEANLELMVYF